MTRLLGAPYLPPQVDCGDWIEDALDGLVEVGGWTAAPIPWPRRRKTGRASLILTDELARAVRTEAVEAIVAHWGVGPTKVWMWRKALGVDRGTEGTRQSMRAASLARTDGGLTRAIEQAQSPEARAKMAETKRGRPASDATRQALLSAARRPKPPGWGKRANAWMAAARKDDPAV